MKRERKKFPLKLVSKAGKAEDGITRITRDENTVIVGGSKELHEKMQETAREFDNEVKKQGKDRTTVEFGEARDAFIRAHERVYGW